MRRCHLVDLRLISTSSILHVRKSDPVSASTSRIVLTRPVGTAPQLHIWPLGKAGDRKRHRNGYHPTDHLKSASEHASTNSTAFAELYLVAWTIIPASQMVDHHHNPPTFGYPASRNTSKETTPLTFRPFAVAVALLSLLLAPISVHSAAAQNANAPQPIKYHLADCHFHYVDFLQHTDGIKAALKAMDDAGVDDTMICGMPLVKKWSTQEPIQPQYYLEDDARCYWYSATDIFVARDVMSLNDHDRARFHPFICGFNGTDRNAVEHVQRMLEWYPGLWQGIGEVMARHDDLTALTYGDTAQADSVALQPVLEIASKYDLPVFIHSDVSSVWKRDPIYLHEIETAVKANPKTKIV